jgi:type IV secretory pathway VirB9-like protein
VKKEKRKKGEKRQQYIWCYLPLDIYKQYVSYSASTAQVFLTMGENVTNNFSASEH